MKKMNTRAILAGVAAGGCIAAGALIGTGQASALSVDEYSTVRQVLCTDAGLPVDVSYINAYGNYTSRANVTIKQDGDDSGRACAYLDLQAGEYGQYVSADVTAEDGGYTYCAIYVDGQKVAESEDDSAYYSFASCY